MKFIEVLLFVGLFCAAASAKTPLADHRAPRNTINQHFKDFIHNERVNFPCGWPDSDMGPIEPFPVEELEISMDSSSEFSAIQFVMTNALATGHKHMWINDLDLRVAGLILTMDMSIAQMQIVGDHRTSANMMNGAITIPISGNGRVNMDVNNVRVFVTAQMTLLQPGGFLNITRIVSTVLVGEVEANLTGFGPLDGPVSRMISNLAPEMVNQNQERVNEGVINVIVPGINNFLNQHTLTSLVNLMADRNQNPPPRRCFW